jgi:hypothetical protein
MNWQQITMQIWVRLNMNKTEGRMLTDLFSWGLNIMWSCNQQLQPCLPRCLSRGPKCLAVDFLLFQQVHLGPFGTHRTLQQFCCFLPPVPVIFQNHKDGIMRAAGILQVPNMCSRDILQQAKGITWSSPLRSDGSRDDQAGETCPVELQLSGGQDSQN